MDGEKTYSYRERDEVERQSFLKTIAQYSSAQIIYVAQLG
jgi:hypothetical protein